MIRFLIQTDNKDHVKHDFSFALVEAVKYNNWFHNEKVFEVDYIIENFNGYDYLDPLKFIPVGSIEFILEYLEKYFQLKPPPLNIPDVLFNEQYLKRKCQILTKEDIPAGNFFVKTIDKIKGFTEVISDDHSTIPEGNFLVSEIVNIDSEWRCFVYKHKLVGLQNYSGEFTIFPNVSDINSMIAEYTNSPIAYTLDVGVSNRGTFVIECHDFYSCGLYGFSDYRILPYMLKDWYFEYLKRNKL